MWWNETGISGPTGKEMGALWWNETGISGPTGKEMGALWWNETGISGPAGKEMGALWWNETGISGPTGKEMGALWWNETGISGPTGKEMGNGSVHTAKTVDRKFKTNIHRNETVQPRFQFLQGKQVDRLWEYINRSQVHESGIWD